MNPANNPPKRKIVRIIARLNIGGAAHHVVLLNNAFNNDLWKSILVTGTPSPGEGSADYLFQRHPPGPLWRIPELQRSIHPIKDGIALWKIFRILLRERPNILDTHTAKAGTIGRTAGLLYQWFTRRRLIMIHTFHGHVLHGYFTSFATQLFIRIERALAKKTACLIAVSQTVKEELVSYRIAPASHIQVVPLGLALEPLLGLNAVPPTEKPAVIRLGFIGRLVPIKNPFMLLEAVQKLRTFSFLPPVQVVIVGDGELRTALQEKCRQLGLEAHVEFTGWRQDLRDIYRLLDIVCLTSRNEGTPVSMIEALAAGKPVIATDVGGVRELLCDASSIKAGEYTIGQHGLLVQSDDAAGMARALAFLIQQPALRHRMGQAGKVFVREKYMTDRLFADMGRLYEELAGAFGS